MARKPLSEASIKSDKSKTPRGPITRIQHIFYRAVDTEGNSVDGIKLDVVAVFTDARKVVDFMDSEQAAGLKRFVHKTTTMPREDGSEDTTSEENTEA